MNVFEIGDVLKYIGKINEENLEHNSVIMQGYLGTVVSIERGSFELHFPDAEESMFFSTSWHSRLHKGRGVTGVRKSQFLYESGSIFTLISNWELVDYNFWRVK